MRVFVTGATGFIGSAIVDELIGAGHAVTGLARSEESGKKLKAAGARVLLGDVENLDCLRRGAAAADGVVHTAFYHRIGHMNFGTRLRVFLGGTPSGIVTRFLTSALDADRKAMETMGQALAGQDRALVAAFATMSLKPGRVGTEDDPVDAGAVGGLRGASEQVLQTLAARGVRTSVIRLPPSVHGTGDYGFVPQIIKTARKKRESAYVGDGANHWPAVHRLDAARLFRLALERGPVGGTYHGVAEEGVPFRDIAGLIGRRLSVPVVSETPAEAAKRFSFLSPFVSANNLASSKLTQERLGWRPTGPGLLADMEQADYFKG